MDSYEKEKRERSLKILNTLITDVEPGLDGKIRKSIAEYLLNYGVEVPPIKLGTDVYTMWYDPDQEEWIIDKVLYTPAVAWRFNHLGLDVFLTRQEALKKRMEIKQRKRVNV